MKEEVKAPRKFPEEPPPWFKWIGAAGLFVLWLVRMLKELFRT